MTDTRLRQELAHLHAELERTSSVDPRSRALLEHLVDDIERLLDETDDEPDSLGERLTEVVRHFENEHPKLALAVGRIAEALSSLGI